MFWLAIPNEHGPVNGLCQEYAADYAGELCQAYAADYAQVYVLAMFWPSCVVQTVNSVNSDKEGADKRPARSLDASLDDFQTLECSVEDVFYIADTDHQ